MTHYDWKDLYVQTQDCKACGLWEKRTNVVMGEGNPKAKLMFIGEGPGREEDLSGRPFVGPAGRLLDKMIEAIGLKREEVYIANIVCCRPPGNRAPLPEEASACLPRLRGQFALIRPQIIVCLGATAAKYIYDPEVRITRDRGIWKCQRNVWLLPTYHPAALLRDESKKRDAWHDFKQIKEKYDALT